MMSSSTRSNQLPSESVTLQIQGNRLIEQGEHQMYRDRSITRPPVEITLTSIEVKKAPKVTVEIRSSGRIPNQ